MIIIIILITIIIFIILLLLLFINKPTTEMTANMHAKYRNNSKDNVML